MSDNPDTVYSYSRFYDTPAVSNSIFLLFLAESGIG